MLLFIVSRDAIQPPPFLTSPLHSLPWPPSPPPLMRAPPQPSTTHSSRRVIIIDHLLFNHHVTTPYLSDIMFQVCFLRPSMLCPWGFAITIGSSEVHMQSMLCRWAGPVHIPPSYPPHRQYSLQLEVHIVQRSEVKMCICERNRRAMCPV